MTKERLKLRYVPLTIFILVMIPIITLVVLFNASLKEKTDVDISKDNEIIERNTQYDKRHHTWTILSGKLSGSQARCQDQDYRDACIHRDALCGE